jgi:hypothetical protein
MLHVLRLNNALSCFWPLEIMVFDIAFFEDTSLPLGDMQQQESTRLSG